MILWTQSDFLRRSMRYLVWIHSCKQPNYDFWISQGSVATVLRWGGQNCSHLRQFSLRCCVPKLIRIDQCFTQLFKKITLAQFFLRHGVYCRGCCYAINSRSRICWGRCRKVMCWVWIIIRHVTMLPATRTVRLWSGRSKQLIRSWRSTSNNYTSKNVKIEPEKFRPNVKSIHLSLIHIWRCRRSYACRSRWSPYH